MRDIVKFTSETGLDVTITPDDVRNVLCPNATDTDLALFLELCAAQKLNPFIGDAYLVKYKQDQPAQMVTGKAVFLKRAQANPRFKGFKAGVVYMDGQGRVNKREGGAVYEIAGERLIGGWCEVLIDKMQPVYNEVSLAEYSTGRSMWKDAEFGGKPATMIRKVALCQSLREAMPTDFQGMYSEEEAAAEVIEVQNEPEPVEIVTEPVEPEPYANGEQLEQINKYIFDIAGFRNVSASDVMEQLLNCRAMVAAGVKRGEELTVSQADTAIKQLSIWLDKAIVKASE